MQMQALKHIFLGLAFIASLVQSLGLSTMRLAQLDGYGTITLICASPDKTLSLEAISASKDLAKLLSSLSDGAETPDSSEFEHCAECVVTVFAVLKNVMPIGTAQYKDTSLYTGLIYQPQFAHKPHGPPLGGRAPPVFI